MRYFHSHVHAFVDYSAFTLKAEFIAVLSTATTSFVLLILFPAMRIRVITEQSKHNGIRD